MDKLKFFMRRNKTTLLVVCVGLLLIGFAIGASLMLKTSGEKSIDVNQMNIADIENAPTAIIEASSKSVQLRNLSSNKIVSTVDLPRSGENIIRPNKTQNGFYVFNNESREVFSIELKGSKLEKVTIAKLPQKVESYIEFSVDKTNVAAVTKAGELVIFSNKMEVKSFHVENIKNIEMVDADIFYSCYNDNRLYKAAVSSYEAPYLVVGDTVKDIFYNEGKLYVLDSYGYNKNKNVLLQVDVETFTVDDAYTIYGQSEHLGLPVSTATGVAVIKKDSVVLLDKNLKTTKEQVINSSTDKNSISADNNYIYDNGFNIIQDGKLIYTSLSNAESVIPVFEKVGE